MSSEDKLIEKARTFAKNGELQRAKDILEELESERAKSLLNKVNQAIQAKKQEALAQRSQAPEKPKNQALPDYSRLNKSAPEKNGGLALVLLAIVIICGVCWIGFASTMPQEPQSSIETVCEWQEMTGGNSCTPERIMRDYRPMVDACYEIWRTANTYNIVEWSNCLENKSVDLID